MSVLGKLRLTICLTVSLVVATGAHAQSEGTSADTGIFGQVRQGRYWNSIFKFEIQFPAKWIVIDNEDAKEFLKAGIKVAELDEKELERTEKYRVGLLSVLKKPMGSESNATIAVSAIKQPSNSVKLLTLAGLTRRGLAQSPAIKLETDPSVVNIGGKEFATFDYTMTLGDRSAKGKYLVTMVREYSITLFLTHETSNDGAIISSILNSIKFY
jgi:hypothetical protein